MKKIDIYEELKSNDYPGRGIVIGKVLTVKVPLRHIL